MIAEPLLDFSLRDAPLVPVPGVETLEPESPENIEWWFSPAGDDAILDHLIVAFAEVEAIA